MERKSFSKEFKLQVVQELSSGKTMTEICREHNLKTSLVCRWRREHEQGPQYAFAGNGKPSKEQTKVVQLEQKIGQLTMEVDFLKRMNASLQSRFTDIKKTR